MDLVKEPGEDSNATSATSPKPEQIELFTCDIANWPLKDDMASMELPIFSLAKKRDTELREFRRGAKVIRIIPSSVGAATVFDKDLLLYVASHIVEALNQGKLVSRTVEINSSDFLTGTARGDGRASFERIVDMLRRLRGTTIETNVETGGIRQTEGFSLIDNYKLISEHKRSVLVPDKESGKPVHHEVTRVLRFSVTISEWLFNGLTNFEVLTLDRGYFQLSSSIERRLYEIARKFCGDQAWWKINIDLLADRIGTEQPRFRLRKELRDAIAGDRLPQYHIGLDATKKPDDVIFYTRDSGKLSRELVQKAAYDWFNGLERHDKPLRKL